MKNQLKTLTYSILNEESDDKNKINDIELDTKPKEFENKLLDQETHLHTNENIKELDLEIYKQKLCASCNIVRPPKAGHCWRCNHCVKGFDHHCYFVGNCVGIRNWRNFILFVVFGFLLCLYDLSISIFVFLDIINKNQELYNNLAQNSGAIFIVFGVLIILICCLMMPLTNILKLCTFIIFVFVLIINFHSLFDFKMFKFSENPCFLLINIGIMIPLTLWLMGVSFVNCDNVMKGMTLKELSSLGKSLRSLKNPIHINYYNLNYKEKIRNILFFMIFSAPKSEINFEEENVKKEIF